MNWIALKILLGDRSKYLGLIFGIAFSTLLIAQQFSIFAGVMNRTASTILDIRDIDIWVMDKRVENLDIVIPLKGTALDIVRSVPGVLWAVPLFKSPAMVNPVNGRMNQAHIIGLDDISLVGAPRKMISGNWRDLHKPNAVLIDSVGYEMLWPEEKGRYPIGKVMEINDRRAVVWGVVDATPSFQFFPIIYTTYDNALSYSNTARNQHYFLLVKCQNNTTPEQVVDNINKLTPFLAKTRSQFRISTMMYYIKNTGIPINFIVTIGLGLIVGVVVVSLLLNMFVTDNIKQFSVLKAMGIENKSLISIVLLQAFIVFIIGFSIGSGLSSLFFLYVTHTSVLKGMYMPWFVMLLTGTLILIVIIFSSLFSLIRVFKVDPAIVFKG